MIPRRTRWRAAGVAALFLLMTWACDCGTLQGLVSSGGEATLPPTPTIIPTATDAPPTATPTITPTPPPTHTPTTAPTWTPAATPTETGVLFEDDFSDPASGWYVDDVPDEGSYAYENGVYAITALSNGLQMWGNAGRSFGDVVITVDATQVSAPANDNNGYGVGCRVQENGDGYYLRISGDGYYAAHRVTYDTQVGDETFTPLVDWTSTNAINLGNATNRIEVTCAGSQLSLYVNGQIVLIAEDDTFTEGDIALTVTTYEDEPTTIHFDNLVVREP